MKQKIIFAMLMGIITTGIISFSLITINVGFNNHFLLIWLRSWIAAYLIVIPVILLAGPHVQKLVNKIIKDGN